MGNNIDGILLYGTNLGTHEEMPWTVDDEEMDIEDWWMQVNDYKSPVHDLFFNGYWKIGHSQPTEEEERLYEIAYKEQKEWFKLNKPPFNIVVHGYDEECQYAIAIPGTTVIVGAGDHEIINYSKMNSNNYNTEAVKASIEKYFGINKNEITFNWLLLAAYNAATVYFE